MQDCLAEKVEFYPILHRQTLWFVCDFLCVLHSWIASEFRNLYSNNKKYKNIVDYLNVLESLLGEIVYIVYILTLLEFRMH